MKVKLKFRDRLNEALAWATRRRALSVGVPTTTMLLITLLLFSYARNVEQERVRLAFETQTGNFANTLSEDFNMYQEVVRSVSSLYAASKQVTRDEFNAFVKRDLERHNGIYALAWIPRVTKETRGSYEKAARDEGFTGFQFKQWTPDGKWVASDTHWADEYFPVYFVQPYAGNNEALGIDLASNITRRAALEHSRDTGQPAASGRITLAQGPPGENGVLIFVPIYRQGRSIETLEERREHLQGFVSGVFRVSDIVSASLATLDRNKIMLQIFDESAEGDKRLLFTGKDLHRDDVSFANTGNLHYSVAYKIGGRDWLFHFMATPQFSAAHSAGQSWLIGIGGVFISALLALTLYLLTERTQMIEQLVEERTSELDRANEALVQSNIELQQFAYVASHDLQAPLRGIAGFAEILQMECSDKLDDRDVHYIARIVDAAKRMQALIKDLLSYSRVESRSRPFGETSLNDAFDDTTALVSASIEDTASTVTRDELPTVMGDRIQLSQLLLNLIENGIKYRGDQPPHVHVSAERHGREWIVSVRDDGIGIDPGHHQQIFEIFHRLHTDKVYPGTGIGLAICQRIVQHHGGRIWVKSEFGKGTTFYFTLPDRDTGEA